MATEPILVEDCSPLIQYSPQEAWKDAEANDTLVASYSGGSYHVTSTQGATATFQFNGTGFEITGGRRPGYGPFSISLDGQQLFEGNPAPASSPVNNTLASVSGLSNDQHTVVLTNTAGVPVDIDTITFETQIGSTGINPNVTIIGDNDPRITYLPLNDWIVTSRPEFQNGTLHLSQAPNATASLHFTGNAIAYYGNVSPNHADVSISIDDETVTLPSQALSNVLAVRTQVLIYWANDLADGEHTMTITKIQSSQTGPFVDVNSFIIYNQSPAGANGSSSLPSTLLNHTGVIVGASVAGVVVLVLIILGLFLFSRIRRQRQHSTKTSVPQITPILPMQDSDTNRSKGAWFSPNGDESAFRFPPSTSLTPLRKAQVNSKRSSHLSIAPSYYTVPDFIGGGGMTERRSVSDPFVPLLGMPVPPAAQLPRTIPMMVATDIASSSSQSPRPSRPRRPPTLNIGTLE